MKENNNNDNDLLRKKMREIAKQFMLKKLQKYDWNMERTAEDLSLTKEELLELMSRYGITSPEV